MLPSFLHKNIILFVIALALFMESVDASIINTAIPVMAQSLNVNAVDLKIALISYLLSLAVFIPISGWIADKFGAKNVFIIALIVFTLSSLGCGFSRTLSELIVARCIQGLGGSLMLPIGRLIILRSYERHQMVNAMSRVIMVVSFALMIGPVLGGMITHYFSWPWIFWVNVPVGFFAVLAAARWLEKMPKRAVPPLDRVGFLLFGVGLAMFTFGLSALSESAIADSTALLIIFVAVLLFIFYLVHSRKVIHPVINTALFHSRTFSIAVLGNLFSRLSFGGLPFLMPLLLQIGLGYSPQTSGLLMAPMAIGVLLVKLFTLRLLKFFGFRRLLMLNTTLVACCLWSFIFVNSTTSIYLIGMLTFCFGLIIAVQYSGMNALAFAEISTENLSSATSVMGTLQQIAQSFGVALGALLLRYYSINSNFLFNLIPPVFHHVFFTMGVITLFSTVIFLQLKMTDGHELLEIPQESK